MPLNHKARIGADVLFFTVSFHMVVCFDVVSVSATLECSSAAAFFIHVRRRGSHVGSRYLPFNFHYKVLMYELQMMCHGCFESFLRCDSPSDAGSPSPLIPLPSRERGYGWCCLAVIPALWILDQVQNDDA